jgi:hypothetical protein
VLFKTKNYRGQVGLYGIWLRALQDESKALSNNFTLAKDRFGSAKQLHGMKILKRYRLELPHKKGGAWLTKHRLCSFNDCQNTVLHQ